mgnify:CR=1 FL=1
MTATIEPAGAPPRDENGHPWRLMRRAAWRTCWAMHPADAQRCIAAWVAGDPLKNDVLTVRASAQGLAATRRNVEVTITRVAGTDPAAEPEIRGCRLARAITAATGVWHTPPQARRPPCRPAGRPRHRRSGRRRSRRRRSAYGMQSWSIRRTARPRRRDRAGFASSPVGRVGHPPRGRR